MRMNNNNLKWDTFSAFSLFLFSILYKTSLKYFDNRKHHTDHRIKWEKFSLLLPIVALYSMLLYFAVYMIFYLKFSRNNLIWKNATLLKLCNRITIILIFHRYLYIYKCYIFLRYTSNSTYIYCMHNNVKKCEVRYTLCNCIYIFAPLKLHYIFCK